MFTYELQRRLAAKGAPTIAVAAHPGVADTELMRHIPGPACRCRPSSRALVSNSAAMGALPTLRAATDPAVQGGQYYGPDGHRRAARPSRSWLQSSKQSHDEAIQRRLWTVSEELTGVTYPV